MHYGWAIEGAIGSEFKIDASYLSPHVTMASRLEAVTNQYQVLILMSEPLQQLCSAEMSVNFRTVDHVMFKGGKTEPIRLHTVDLNCEVLRADSVPRKVDKNPFELRMEREKAKDLKMQESFKVYKVFQEDADVKKMRHGLPQRFLSVFSKGYLNYEAGEWDVARTVFERTRMMMVTPDGPSEVLLNFMGQYDYDASRVDAPKGWQGYRELTET